MKGFESVARDNVTVTVDQVSTVNIALRVGSVNDTVTASESGRPVADQPGSGSRIRPDHGQRQFSASIPVRVEVYILNSGSFQEVFL
jgi:hypothetical protein